MHKIIVILNIGIKVKFASGLCYILFFYCISILLNFSHVL